MFWSRTAIVVLMALMESCGTAPPAAKAPAKPDPATEPWYAPAVAELVSLQREAESALGKRQTDRASELITKAQPGIAKVLGVPRPTLEAMSAAAALDELYARMLMQNRHYGPACFLLNKNVARWKNWQPRDPAVESRLLEAQRRASECQRNLGL